MGKMEQNKKKRKAKQAADNVVTVAKALNDEIEDGSLKKSIGAMQKGCSNAAEIVESATKKLQGENQSNALALLNLLQRIKAVGAGRHSRLQWRARRVGHSHSSAPLRHS